MKNKIKKLCLYIKEFGFLSILKFIFFYQKKKIIKINFKKSNFYIRPNFIDLRQSYQNLFEEYDELKDLIKSDFSGIILDAGGFIGSSSLKLLTLFPNAKIIAIEPDKENFELMKINLGNKKNIKILNYALSSENLKNVHLYDRGTGDWGYTTIDNLNSGPKKKLLVQTINIKEIKKIFVNHGKIDLMKIDINGGEKEILEKCQDDLKMIDVIYIELHERIVSGSLNLFREFTKNEKRKLIEIRKNRTYISLKV
tara:strand:- start:185 stop:946 length:762 start_codon:yes stop_codon:yes gene_type:complete